VNQTSQKPPTGHRLDAMTGGAFSAPTASERATRIREWLASDPAAEDMTVVFRELSGRDKGAAKPIREKLDELKRAKGQQSLAAEWAERGHALLALPRLNIADALAWQRDAARAGAPLSREPLAGLKAALGERVRVIEDLHHRVMVQREASVLLAQRIELLSTKPWRDAQTAHEVLTIDMAQWQQQAAHLAQDSNWASVDPKYPPLLEASRAQLLAVWTAFEAALEQARGAAADPSLPLPAVPVWADELRAGRGLAVEAAQKPARPKIDPEQRARASEAVKSALDLLESEMALGHGKASASAAANLRAALREFGRLVDDGLENQAHAALAAAGELEGWQRWRADQLRRELVDKAESLLKRPEGQALGGRKMQESLRGLREQWKQTDQGGVPNHALWKRFDEACNEAYKVVAAWLERVKAEAALHRQQRLDLIEELKAWGRDHADSQDWKVVLRALHQFADRWRDAGHLGEKAFVDLQKAWGEAMEQAAAGLEQAREASLARRQAMIEESVALGAASELRIDAVRALQQRWQLEAQSVPLDRRQEQKLWDSFRKPIDEAFQRKTEERERAVAQRMAQLSERDRRVLDAAKQLEEASAEGDAQKLRTAMSTMEAAMRGEAPGPAAPLPPALAQPDPGPSTSEVPVDGAQATGGAAVVTAPARPSRVVVAVRGDDRPGMKRTEPVPAMGRRGASPDRAQGRPDGRRPDTGRPIRGPSAATVATYQDARGAVDRGPRLGDLAFRAQREAMERAEQALRRLAAQAHGEVVTGFLAAWEKRDPQLLPSQQSLGKLVGAGIRANWQQALAQPAVATVDEASQLLIRLEIAAELPTPAEFQDARRALQLQMLTRRSDPAPAQSWPQDLARLLACAFDSGLARRAQGALKALLRR
jgi:ATP-dependent RNA helicase SUPV3L1/SUV3